MLARVLLLLLLGVAPALAQSTPAAAPPQTPLAEAYGAFGHLETTVTQVRRPNCWKLMMRGRLHNPYDQAVDGVRLIVRLRASGEEAREIERVEMALDLELDPGETVPFNREVPTPCTSSFNDIAVVAFAAHRGASTLPTPGREIELAAGRAEQALAGPNIPIVTNPVVP